MRRDYGFGAFKIDLPLGASRKDREMHSRAMLARAVDSGTLVAMVGTGMSRNLGYPDWKEFARLVVVRTSKILEEVSPDVKARQGYDGYRERLLRFEGYFAEKNVPADRLIYFIGECQGAFDALKIGREKYNEFLEETFKEGTVTPQKHPFDELVKLPIRRFVTTNYDCEIEQALKRRYHLPWQAFGIGQPPDKFKRTGDHPRPLSFTQESEYLNELALFALADEKSNRNMVFHCHGRWDRPDSVVASEQDYQRWYLSEKHLPGRVFRQTADLLFRSNPILFLGYSLKDEELLLTLRRMVANELPHRSQYSYFALVHNDEEEESDQDHFQHLYQKYGVHVIPYPKPSPGEEWSSVLCEAIRRIGEDWANTRKSWISKPLLRRATPRTKPPEACWYPKLVDPPHLNASRAPSLVKHIEEVEKELSKKELRVLVLSGDSSRKKTWISHELINRLECKRSYDGIFYWNAHYADDALNALEKLVSYVRERVPAETGSLLDRFERIVNTLDLLLVLDGGERLLRCHEISGQIDPASPILASLLEIVENDASRSKVLFICQEPPSRWINSNGDCHASPRVENHRVLRLEEKDLRNIEPFQDVSEELTRSLNAVLDGHFYGLLLVSRFLERARIERKSPDAELAHLILRVAREPKGNRITTLLKMHLEELDRRTRLPTTPFIRRAGSFVSPFGRPTLKICFELACLSPDVVEEISADDDDYLDAFVATMVEEGLMTRVKADHAPDKQYFLVHPTVRGFLFDRYEHSHQGVLPDFGLSGLTSGKRRVWPETSKQWSVEGKLFDRLLECAANSDEPCSEETRDLVRRAFSLLRSRMSVVASPNWTTYDKSFKRLLELLVAVKRASPNTWMHAGRTQLREVEHENGVLYPADLAWLYNELGLCLQLEGFARDAWQIWEQGHEINCLIEGAPEKWCLGEYEIQSLLNMTQVAIDSARLSLAEERVKEAEKISAKIDTDDLKGQILGYKGVLSIFYGDSKVACEYLTESTRLLGKAGNQRALCYFLGHWASAEAQRHRYDDAEAHLKRAQALASKGQYRDFSLNLQAQHIKTNRETTGSVTASTKPNRPGPTPRERLSALLLEVQSGGMRKHEPTLYSELAKVALEQGDAQGARWAARRAVALTNRLGVKARQLRSMFSLAKAIRNSVNPKEKEFGITFMLVTARLARRSQYWLLNEDARRELHEWGHSPDKDDLELQPDVPL